MKPYEHFTLTERQCLEKKINEGKSNAQIAREMDRNRSTIGREIKRNFSKKAKHYNSWRANCLYIERHHKSVRKYKIQPDTALYDFIKNKLNEYWSPEIISNVGKRESLFIVTSTIYYAIRRGALEQITAKTHLRRRNKKIKHNRKSSATIKPEHTIHERPEEAQARSQLGDFEGDTVLGAVGKGALVTMVDRKSRYLVAGLSVNKTAETVRKAIKQAFILSEIELPIKTITLDNGSEFAQFKGIEDDLKTTIYFADPQPPTSVIIVVWSIIICGLVRHYHK